MALELEKLTGKIIGSGIEVHRQLGPGFIESIYENALVYELRRRGLRVEQQLEVLGMYAREVEVGKHRLDLYVEGQVVVELKAISSLEDVHFAIVCSYLRATGNKHGLLLNFAKVTLEAKRVIAQ